MGYVLFLAVVAAAIYLARRYSGWVNVERDDFRKTVWFNSNRKGGSSALGMQYWLRAYYREGQLGRIQVYCSSREKDWRFYHSATGEDSTELEFVRVDSDVVDANVKLGGSIDTVEKFALNIPLDYLRKMAGKDWQIKIYGKRGDEVITIKQKAAAEFLALIERIEQEPGTLTDGSIKSGDFRKAALAVAAIPLAFLFLIIYLGIKNPRESAPDEVASQPEATTTAAPAAAVDAEPAAPDCNPPMNGENCMSSAGGAASSKYLGAVVTKDALPDGLQLLVMSDYSPVVMPDRAQPVAYVASVFNDKETMLWLLQPQGSDYRIVDVVTLPVPGSEPSLGAPGECSYPKPTDPYVFFALVNRPTDVDELTSTQFLTEVTKAWSVDGDEGNLHFKEIPGQGVICNNSSYGL